MHLAQTSDNQTWNTWYKQTLGVCSRFGRKPCKYSLKRLKR